MKTQLDRLIRQLQVGQPLTHERMTVAPLYVDETSPLEYLTLDEATERDLVRVDEVGPGGSVPEMKVTNRAAVPILIPDGTALVGSKQNRVVNLTILIDAESETVIPVSCVEQGRWSRSGRSSKPSGYSDKGLRRAMCAESTEALKEHGKVAVSQGKVWSHVGKILHRSKSRSKSAAYHDMFAQAKAPLDEYEKRFGQLERACGAAVLIDGKVEGADLFDKPETFAKLWPGMLRGYAAGAVFDDEARGKESQVESFLETIESAETDLFEPVGIGTNLRLTSKETIGAALLFRETAVHLSLFAN